MSEQMNRFTYQPQWGFRRQPVRPVDLQVLDFHTNYDYDTFWNDAVQVNANTILLIGPPLYESVQWLNSTCRFLDQNRRVMTWRFSAMDRAQVIRLDTENWMNEFHLETPFGRYTFQVNHATADFNNLKVMVTISQDHPVSWLQQWIDYHNRVHNIEGILIYNNRSRLYTSDQLHAALQRSDMVIKVVDYDVPFGVMGGGDWAWEGRQGHYLPWDSDFSQYVMLEHAKWRYLHCARLAINADTDELLLINNSNLNGVADYCATGQHSVLLYDGVWIEPIDSVSGVVAADIPQQQRHFSQYWHTTNGNGRGIGVKWLLNPQRNMNYQWHLHKTYGPHAKTKEITFGHYFAMNTNWSYQRDKFLGNREDLQENNLLKQHLKMWQQHTGAAQ